LISRRTERAGNGLQGKFSKQVKKIFKEETTFLSRLGKIKSLIGQEGEGQKFYAEPYSRLGMKIEMITPLPPFRTVPSAPTSTGSTSTLPFPLF